METGTSVRRNIEAACAAFRLKEPELFERELHERTITARLSIYLQRTYEGTYFVDCEYSKMRDGNGVDVPKSLMDWPADRVYPDIIIHKRTPDNLNNLAVIEAKWRKSSRKVVDETEKVRAYLTEPYLKYKYGFIWVLDEPSKVKIVRDE